MTTIFFTGKGGVGKTTLSCALAWQLAEQGRRVLVVSLDPAHNLGDVFDVRLSHRKKKHGENLYLLELDLAHTSNEYVKDSVRLLEQTYGYMRTLNMEKYFRVLKYSPGVEEYAALIGVERILRRETDFDFIVFDTPPTGLTLKILALPGVTLAWIDRLIDIRKQILDKRYTIQKLSGTAEAGGVKLPYREEDDPVMQKLSELKGRYGLLMDCLMGEENSIVVTFNPDRLSLRESDRLMDGLDELGLPLRVAFDNKITDENVAVAASIEQELLHGRSGVHLARVPLQRETGAASYAMSHDLTEAFV